MKIEELRKLDQSKLQQELTKAKEAAFKVRFEVRNNSSNNISEVAKAKKYVAQIRTVMNEKKQPTENNLEKKD